jgi:hypothetical protein
MTVATEVAEAEANIRTVHERHTEKAIRFAIDISTLPSTNPLAKCKTRAFRRFTSPLQKIAQLLQDTEAERMETIVPYAISLWDPRIATVVEPDNTQASEIINRSPGVQIATSTSAKNGLVGYGGATEDTSAANSGTRRGITTFSTTLGLRLEQNPYTAELAAILEGLKCIPADRVGRRITVFASNQAALLAINHPKRQSGQDIIRQIYDTARQLGVRQDRTQFVWVPASATSI